MSEAKLRWGYGVSSDLLIREEQQLSWSGRPFTAKTVVGRVVQRGMKWGVLTKVRDGFDPHGTVWREDLTLNFDTKEEAKRYAFVVYQMTKP